MNLHRWFATVFVLLALAGCAQSATEPGQAPCSSGYNGEYPRDRGGDGGGEAVEGAVCSGQGNQT